MLKKLINRISYIDKERLNKSTQSAEVFNASRFYIVKFDLECALLKSYKNSNKKANSLLFQIKRNIV